MTTRARRSAAVALLMGTMLAATPPADLATARRIVKRAGGQSVTTVRVVQPRYSEPALDRLRTMVRAALGGWNPDYSIDCAVVGEKRTTRCGSLTLLLSDQAADWVRDFVARNQRRWGDRIVVKVVAPDQIPERVVLTRAQSAGIATGLATGSRAPG